MSRPRIASLLPSATEIVCAVGARDQLVGVSHECDWPVGVDELPHLTRPRAELPRASADIDRAIREVLADALAVYAIELERLEAVAPDVIVTQDLCDVCAVSIDDVRRALAELARQDVEIVSLRPTRLGDVWDDVRRVGQALGRADRGTAVAADLEARVARIAERARDLERPSVVTIEWLDPVMIGGTWMPELVDAAGGSALVTEPGQHAPTLGPERLAELDPDVVLIKPCGFQLEHSSEELALIRERLPHGSWSAFETGRVYVADGSAYFNRSGPRLVESCEILAACLHPTLFADFAYAHRASVRRLTRELELAPLVPQ